MKEITFTFTQVLQILENVRVDIRCGACCEIAFTGLTTNKHECKEGSKLVNSLKRSL